MKEILTRNLGLKILSVIIAFFIWFAVVSVSNPLENRSREIPLEVQNAAVLENAGLAYELDTKKSTVTVNYQVHSMDQNSVSAADFRAYINLADYYPATGTVPVSVEVLNNKDYLLESVAVKPGVIRVKTEQIQEKDFDLQVNPQGTPAAGYEVDRIELHPKMVTLRGPESIIGRINSVGVEINIQDIRAETANTAVPIFYDANGNKLSLDERVSMNVKEIAYTVYVMKTKVLALEFDVSGEPAENCRYMGMETSADTVSVIGVESVIASIPSIRIPGSVLNLDGATEDRVIVVDVEDYLPDKENISIPWNSQVTVRLKVEKLEQKTLIVPTNRIIEEGENSAYLYEYSSDSVEITLEGLNADLEGIEVSDLSVEMDVSQMLPGTHQGVLTIDGLEEVLLVGHSDFQVIVSTKESRRETEESSSEEDHTPAGSNQVEALSPGHSETESASGSETDTAPGSEAETESGAAAGDSSQQTPEFSGDASAEETGSNGGTGW